MPGGRSWREWSESPGSRSPKSWEGILRPLLEPGEDLRHAFEGTSGRRGTRWLGADSRFGWRFQFTPFPRPLVAYALGVENYVVAVTDRSIVVLRSTLTTNRPREVVARLPRATRIGMPSPEGVITVAGIEIYLHDVADVRAAQDVDAEQGY